MINFRYHVVSLAAVFLALAIGLVVGTAAANGPLAENLNDQINKITDEKQQLRDDLEQSRAELKKNADFATQVAPMLLNGKLTNRNVALVKFAGSDDDVNTAADGIATMLGTAGAKVVGTITVNQRFTAAASNDLLLDLAESWAPPAISGALPTTPNGVERSATLLASVLVTKAGAPQVEGARTVLSMYENSGFISLDGDFKAPAEAVIIVAGAPASGKDAKERNTAAMTIATRFDLAGPTVVAGLSANGLVSSVRGDASIAKTTSTVDNAVTAYGQVAAVMALVERLGGKTGHYGIGDGATSLLPKTASAANGS
ncbi:copper transporter [Dactylosporangium roseum]|uniref:Copper transporter n=1 Tax=Dactylosporangium roseum TaxID=47989 RepID=A0ABY5YYN8_9ACTN|nr:copper transporter [Dactylosporangium roseum]UWZ34869.1 copper transporter [Dactylosporangium roseum]